jgi:hypothetical protein
VLVSQIQHASVIMSTMKKFSNISSKLFNYSSKAEFYLFGMPFSLWSGFCGTASALLLRMIYTQFSVVSFLSYLGYCLKKQAMAFSFCVSCLLLPLSPVMGSCNFFLGYKNNTMLRKC